MKTLFVRIKPKSGAIGFFRCGMKFTPAWQKVENIDDATAMRLEQEQMLEVSEAQPDDYVDDPVVAEGDAAQTAASESSAAKPKKGGE